MGDMFASLANMGGQAMKTNQAEQALGYTQQGLNAYNNLNPNVQMPSNVQADQGTLANQNAILSNIMGKIRQGGLNASDLANIQATQGRTNQMNNQGIQAGLEQAKMQGGGANGGQSGILASLMGGQQGANNANQQGYQTSAMGLQNQNNLSALGGQQAGNLQDQLTNIATGNVTRQQQQRQSNEQNAAQRAGGITNAGAAAANAANGVGTNQANLAGTAGVTGQGILNSNWSNYFGGGGGGTQGQGPYGDPNNTSSWGSAEGMD